MKVNRRIPIVSAILAAAISLTLLAAPAAFSQELDPVPVSQPSQTDGRLIEAQFYAQRFGVTVDEALRRFDLQDIGRPLMSELEAKEPETYAGMWLQHTPDFRIVVQFTRDGEATMSRHMLKGLEDVIEVRQVPVSYLGLQKAQSELIASFRTLGMPGESDIDIIGNKVTADIAKANRPQFDAAIQEGRISLSPNVEVVIVEGLSVPTVDMYGGLTLIGHWPPWGSVTSGFSVIRPSDGQKGIITAGHAQDTLDYWYGVPYVMTFRGQGYGGGGSYDVQWNTNDSLTIRNKFVWWRDTDGTLWTFDCTATKGRDQMFIGETVSKYGKTTYYTAGTIETKNAQVYFDDQTWSAPTFIKLQNSFGYSRLVDNGDSGGPCFSGNTAYGITTNRSTDYQKLYFMASNYVNPALGVNIMTSP